MADAANRQSPLASLAGEMAGASVAGPGGVTIREVPFLAQIGLRGDPGDAGFIEAVEGALGAAPPLTADTVAEAAGRTVLWLGPDEWLVVGPAGTEREIAGALGGALAGRHVSVLDLSAARAVIELGGPKAGEVLAKGCGLDLDRRSFGPGRCAQTLLAKAQVILEQTTDEPAYRLYVRASFATYLARWLIDATAEYRIGGGDDPVCARRPGGR
jgi:sarcosine oxidase subunit gamma